MFSFLRDIALEINGIDAKKARAEREEKREMEKLNRFIFTKGTKRTIIILGIIYIPLSVTSIVGIISDSSYIDSDAILKVIISIILLLLCISICTALFIGKKKGEIFAIIGCFVFVAILYLFFVVL